MKVPPRRGTGLPGTLIIVLTGVDGAGKSTAGRLLAQRLVACGYPAILTRNPCGRSTMTAWRQRFGLQVPAGLLDAVETGIRCANVLVSHLRATCFSGIVIMDRYLYCQLALKGVRGRSPGRLLPWLLRRLPAPDIVFYFDVPAVVAHNRVISRATDAETLENLQALDQAYRELDDFRSFVRIDAGSSPEQIVADIWQELDLSRSRAPRTVPESGEEDAGNR